jgi:prepilin-type N-terminal cleavage/methylation domain-containing protein
MTVIRKQSQAAFSMIEAMVSIAIFGIGSLGIAHAFIYHMSFNTTSERRGAAIAAAQVVLDQLRVSDPASLPNTGSATQNLTVGRRTFVATTSYCSPNTYCTSTARYVKVEIRENGQLYYTVSTVFAQLR